jgi:hypothetical protein
MRKIIVGAMVSMDGVMRAHGAPTEDPTRGFKFGGWVMPYFDQEFGEELDRLFSEKFDLLLGRKTYEICVALGRVDTSWQGSVLLHDIADIRRLRDDDGPGLVTQGSTELVHARAFVRAPNTDHFARSPRHEFALCCADDGQPVTCSRSMILLIRTGRPQRSVHRIV